MVVVSFQSSLYAIQSLTKYTTLGINKQAWHIHPVYNFEKHRYRALTSSSRKLYATQDLSSRAPRHGHSPAVADGPTLKEDNAAFHHEKETCSPQRPCPDRVGVVVGNAHDSIPHEVVPRLGVMTLSVDYPHSGPIYFFPPNTVQAPFGVGVSMSNVEVMVVVVFPVSPDAGVPFSRSFSFCGLLATFLDGGGELSRTPVRRFWRLLLDESSLPPRPVRRREARRRDCRTSH